MQLDGCLTMKQFLGELDQVMFLQERADTILHGHAHDTDDISLLRCMRDGVKEICMGMTEQDMAVSMVWRNRPATSFSMRSGQALPTG